VERVLKRTAQDRPCPNPRTYVYPDISAQYTATCEGSKEFNGFYGHGIVDANAASKD
jgi:hypothetical protein